MKYVYLIYILIVISSSFQCVCATESVNIDIIYSEENIDSYYSINGTNVFDSTKSIVSVNFTYYGDLVFIDGINGIWNNNTSGQWWQYWVNGELGNVACNKYELSYGDKVVWRFCEAYTINNSSENSFVMYIIGMLGFLGIIIVIIMRYKM